MVAESCCGVTTSESSRNGADIALARRGPTCLPSREFFLIGTARLDENASSPTNVDDVILQPRILLPLLCFATAPIVACSEAPESESGSLRMGVAGQDADGNFYRLRSASFDAYGPIYTSFYSDAEPYTTQYIAMDVPTGDYTIQLQPGWYVEQWDPFTDNTYPLEARLISANPATATVAELSTAIVTFSFYVEGVGAISLGDGSLAVDVDFDTQPPVVHLTLTNQISRDAFQSVDRNHKNGPGRFVCHRG